MNLCRSLLESTKFVQCSRGLKSWTGGVDYPAYKYYPRSPDEKDPPFEPTKLLMVQRVKPFKGNEYWLKRILVELRLDTKRRDYAIVKNTPEVAQMLYKVKHLVRILPIRTPNGIPSESELGAGFLKENGEFVVSKKLIPDLERLKVTDDFQTDPARLDAETLMKNSRDKWDNPW